MHNWKKLLELSKGKKIVVKKVFIPEDNITIEGDFQLSNLASLSEEDQKFIFAFIKTHGSIKQMEATFNISYPTVKNKLNELSKKIDNFDLNIEDVKEEESLASVLDKISSGEIDVKDALKELNK
ncbi:MAG: DUF2089 family protein [Sphaerochaetaceae bacterium]|nr:DUF2089 family protein [Sphaerochaetaceae bacterium]MDC7249762.1 DUF2089 family protein [Sphaerochaetaceae bacterium]